METGPTQSQAPNESPLVATAYLPKKTFLLKSQYIKGNPKKLKRQLFNITIFCNLEIMGTLFAFRCTCEFCLLS